MLPLRRPDQTRTNPDMDLLFEDVSHLPTMADAVPAQDRVRLHGQWCILDQRGMGGSAAGAVATAVTLANRRYADRTYFHFETAGRVVNELVTPWYWAAQRADPWAGGEFDGADPKGAGTSLPAVVGVASDSGWWHTAGWGREIDDIRDAVLRVGPVVVGVPWFERMVEPSAANLIRARGDVVGAHAVTLFDVEGSEFRVLNSWGDGWGDRGMARFRFTDLEKCFEAEPLATGVVLVPKLFT